MNYVPGKTIKVGSVFMPKTDLVVARHRTTKPNAPKDDQFKSGHIYHLLHIKVPPEESGEPFTYIFRNVSNTNQIIRKEFDSINSADQFIANLIGEQLPDFTKIYQRKSD